MKLDRTYFQSESAAIEQQLADYINLYPRNIGHVAQWNIALIFVLAGLALTGIGWSKNEDLRMLGIMSLIGGITMWLAYKYMKRKDKDPEMADRIRSRISNLKGRAYDYEEVERYCDTLMQRLNDCESSKKKYEPTFFVISALIALGIGAIAPFHQIDEFQPPVNDFLFSVKAHEPSKEYGDSMRVEMFMDLNNLTKNNSDTIIDVELRIRIFAVVMKNSQKEAFQLMFVDENGQPASRSPRITFKDGSGEYKCEMPVFHALEFKNRLKEGKLRYKVNPIFTHY